jgi:voltage-gated potassium channel
MIRTQIIIAYVIALVAVVIFGIVGTLLISGSGGFNVHVDNVPTALYFTVATISTVGYGDIYPVSTEAMMFVVVLILTGLGTFFSAITLITGEFINTRIAERLSARLSFNERRLLNKHILLIGYGPTNALLADMLERKKQLFIILDKDVDLVEKLRNRGRKAYVADATQESDIKQINIAKAKMAVVDLSDPSVTMHAVIVMKALSKNTNIIIVTSSPETERYMLDMGVKHIVDPARMAAVKIGSMIE